MWKKFKQWLGKKIDVKITGYLCVGIAALSMLCLLWVVGMSVRAEGALSDWVAAVGFGIILANAWSILLARWGQKQTGRKLRWNKAAVWLNSGMIGLMAVIYVLGLF